MGVVYYANYLKWFEMGRTEFLREIGIPYSSIEERGLCFPVTEVSCRYYRPARYDDQLLIETTLTSLGGITLTFGYRVSLQDSELLLPRVGRSTPAWISRVISQRCRRT